MSFYKRLETMIRFISISIILFISHLSIGQVDNDIPIFHRLLIYNADDQLMVVKIENADFWVTPGLYQNKHQTIRQGLDSITSSYGLTIDSLALKGHFILKRQINKEQSTSLRNVYVAKVKEVQHKTPQGIEKIEWLTHKEAIERITFPHIVAMFQQVHQYPDHIWGGSLLQYREDDQWQSRIIEPFYKI